MILLQVLIFYIKWYDINSSVNYIKDAYLIPGATSNKMHRGIAEEPTEFKYIRKN